MTKPDGTPDDTQDENGTPPNTDNQTPPDGTQPKAEGNKPGAVMFTEAQYKGLQAVVAKRDETIKTLTTKITELEANLAEAQSNHGSAVTEKTSLSAQLTDAQSKIEALTKESTTLQKKVKYQDIIMKEYPDLASAAAFIPETETEEDFRVKATEFREALKQYINSGVKNILDGSGLPVSPDGGISTLGVDEEEKAYREVTSLAGRPGKEKEYREAYDRYQAILAKKQQK